MNKIFVSIASYRDSEIIHTVKSLIDNADNPELLRIVIFEQNHEKDITIQGIYPENQVLVLQTDYLNAKGPYWARYIIQQEYKDEEYYMQIDSHMRVIPKWDTILKHILDLVPKPGVLTQYPPEYNLKDGSYDINQIRSGLYIQGFGLKDGFTRIQSDIIKSNQVYFPYTSKGWAACFSFSKGNIVKDAPYDPKLKYLFFGEELDITLRLFTRGYYFYSPQITVIFTLFKRTYRRTYWQDISNEKREKFEKLSINLLKYKIKNNIDIGSSRTIEEYMKFADIESITNQKLKKKAKAFRRKTERILNR